MTNAIVLSGGGLAGQSWETGVLAGLAEASPALAALINAGDTLWVGTSAGATVAAQVTSGAPLATLYDDLTTDAPAEVSPEFDANTFRQRMIALKTAPDPAAARREFAVAALAAPTAITTEQRRAVVEARLKTHTWPDRPLRITAVEAQTGDRAVFDRDSGVPLVDAVAASSAVPFLWPAVEIGDRHYLDGGLWPTLHLDLAAGSDRVLLLLPAPSATPAGYETIVEADRALLADAPTAVVYADPESLRALGPNPLATSTRGPAAYAGRELGRRLAPRIAADLGL